MIVIENLTKYFGDRPAVRDVSFSLSDRQVVGFLGLNGAGKTTLLRMMAGDLLPSSGTVTINGVDMVSRPLECRRQVGFAPENPPLYPDVTVGEYLRYAGRLHGLRGKTLRRRVSEVAERLELSAVLGDFCGTLSHGYQKRVSWAQAIVHQPPLVILDEPISGLDPVQIVEARRRVRDLAEEHTVVVSSHILKEIRETCAQIMMMHEGRLMSQVDGDAVKPSEESLGKVESTVIVPEEQRENLMDTILKTVPGATSVCIKQESPEEIQFVVTGAGDIRDALAMVIVTGGHRLRRLDLAQDPLESHFISLITKGHETELFS